MIWLTPCRTHGQLVYSRPMPNGAAEPTLPEAFELLGLTPGASAERIHAKFRELAANVHPDKPDGDLDAFVRLEAARRVALGATSTALVPLDQVTELVRVATGNLERSEAQRKRADEATKFVGGLVRAHTSKLKRVRRNAGLAAALSAALALALQYVKQKGGINHVVADEISLIAVPPLVLSSIAAWLGHERAGVVAEAIEDASETFDDRSAIVDVLYEIEDTSRNQRPWTRSSLIAAVRAWSGSESGRRARSRPFTALLHDLRVARFASRSLSDLARVIGADDFTRLLLAKGLEHAVIAEEQDVDEGRLYLFYDIALPEA
jgi:hypothetical protein